MTAAFPNPPPPMEPAIAEYPTRLIIVNVSPWINAGSASGIITLNIISFVVAPIALEASISPSSTSFSAPSIILAIKGADPNESGTINDTLP